VTAPPAAVAAEIEAALRRQGLGPCRLTPLSRYQGTKRGRYAFLAESSDGRRVKVRHLASCEAAEEVEGLRRKLEPAFAPVLARHGAVLVEAWVEGRPLEDREAGSYAEEAGALLGRLHGLALEGSGQAELSTSDYLARAEADLGKLSDAGELDDRQAASLRAALGRQDPGSFPGAVIHRDFCGENFIVDGDGRLVVIDNEWFVVGAAGFDVGRTFHRWPMPQAAWRRFLAAYRGAGADPEPLEFWAIVSALFGARVWLQFSPERLPPLRALLHDLSEGRPLPAAR
jgi:Ser/Thr protein kinase RdoA (MazF antagonist)